MASINNRNTFGTTEFTEHTEKDSKIFSSVYSVNSVVPQLSQTLSAFNTAYPSSV